MMVLERVIERPVVSAIALLMCKLLSYAGVALVAADLVTQWHVPVCVCDVTEVFSHCV